MSKSFERRVADVFGALDSLAPKQEKSSLRSTTDSSRECSVDVMTKRYLACKLTCMYPQSVFQPEQLSQNIIKLPISRQLFGLELRIHIFSR